MADPIQLRDAPLGNRPMLHYDEVADAAALAALVLTADDVGRTWKQLDDGSYHTLLDDDPATWNDHASRADITAAIAAMVDSSPSTLDTLNELAAALGDDANFATTVTNALAAKAPLIDPDFTGGNPLVPTQSPGNNTTRAASTAFVTAAVAAAGGVTLGADQTWTGTQTYGDAKLVATSPKVITNFKDVNGNVWLAQVARDSANGWLSLSNRSSAGGETNVELRATNAGGSGNINLLIKAQDSGVIITDRLMMGDGSGALFKAYFTGVAVRSNNDASFERFDCGALNVHSTLTIDDAVNIALNTTTGTKFATSASQKLALWGAAPVVQPSGAAQAALTDSTGGTADGVVEDVTTTGVADPAKVNNNFKEILTLLHALRTALVDAGCIKGSA